MKGRRTALAALALIALVWGYNWVVMKEAMRYAGPFEFLGWRFSLAGVVLFAMLAAMRRPLRLTHAPEVFLIGLFQTACNFGFTAWALLSGAAGKSAVLTYTMPFWVVLLAWPLLRERPAPLQWAAIVLGIAGIALLLGSGEAIGAGWLALVAGVTWSAGVVIAKRLQSRERIDVIAMSAWQAVLGGAVLVAMAVLFPSRETQWSPYLVFAMVYNAVLVSGVCWALWFWVLSRLEAGLASLGLMAVPVIGILSGVVELAERPRPAEWAGIVLVIFALAIVGVVAARPRAPLTAAGIPPAPRTPRP